MISKNSSHIVPKLQPKVLWYSNNGQVHKEIPNIICLWHKLHRKWSQCKVQISGAILRKKLRVLLSYYLLLMSRCSYLANQRPVLTELTNQNLHRSSLTAEVTADLEL